MKTIYKSVLSGFLGLTLLFLFAFDAWGQNYENITGGTYNATCNAVIRMKSTTSTFSGSGQIGTGSGNYIEGAVDWAATADGQTVQGLYYEHLVVSGGAKTMATDIYILGSACPSSFPTYTGLLTYPYYVAAGTGNRTYNGTFYYAGTGDQNLAPEYNASGGNTNNFNILDLSGGGAKYVLAGDNVGVGDHITSASGTGVTINGDLTSGTVASTFGGTVTFNDAGASLVVGSGSVDFNDDITITNGTINAATGAGIVTIGSGSDATLAGTGSVLNFGSGTNLIITGTLTNSGDGTNLQFDCTSTETYNGTQNPQLVVPTIATNQYGTLVLSNGAKRSGTGNGNNVYICKDFSLSDGNFDVYTNSGTLYMTAVDGDVAYPANEEVVGKFSRTTDANLRSYGYNNKYTNLSLVADADNPTSFAFTVRPGVDPEQYSLTTDVHRKIVPEYAGNAGAFNMTIQAGYLFDEFSWDATYTQASLRFWEANAGGIEKVGTGQVYARTAASGAGELGGVQLAGIGNTATSALSNGIGLFASGNDLLLRAGPTTFYTIQNGRWTNPNTWDEGAIPTENDNAEIRHVCYVGIDGMFVGTPGGTDEVNTNNTLRELTPYPTGVAANVITIATGWSNASLIIGNEDNGNDYVFKTKSTAGNSFINNNTNAASLAFPLAVAKGSVDPLTLNGLWLMPLGNTGSQISAFGTYQIQNSGSVNNEGIIEVGQ